MVPSTREIAGEQRFFYNDKIWDNFARKNALTNVLKVLFRHSVRNATKHHTEVRSERVVEIIVKEL